MAAKSKAQTAIITSESFDSKFQKDKPNIFVFETDKNGIHSTRSAQFALTHCGAAKGQGYGLWGNSFALPVLDVDLQLLPIYVINSFVSNFLEFARINSSLTFYVFPIAQNLMGYKPIHIAPLFAYAPENCILPNTWLVQNHKL